MVKIRARTIDMSKADGQSITEFDLIKRALGDKYRSNLLYRGFDGKRIDRVLETGRDTESPILFLATEEVILGNDDRSAPNPLDYAFDQKIPALSVYAPEKVAPINPHAHEYRVEDESSLVAVFRLNY